MQAFKESSTVSARIKTVVRCRPFSSNEALQNPKVVTEVHATESLLLLNDLQNPGSPAESFTFDACFDDKVSQKEFYQDSCQKIVKNVLDGNDATIVTYGQSASGKTYSLIGPSYQPVSDDEGVIFRACDDLLESLDSKSATLQYSMIDLYQDEIQDLLATSKDLKLSLIEQSDKKVAVKDATWLKINTSEEFRKITKRAFSKRSTNSRMNERSYPAHFMCKFLITKTDPRSGEKVVSTLTIFDLAGLERISVAGDAKSKHFKGAIQTNLGLFAFRKVVSSLAKKEKSAPYRESKLTRLLKDFLVGDSTGLLIVTVAQSELYYKETLATLRFTQSFKNISSIEIPKPLKISVEKPEANQIIGVWE